MGQDKRDPAMPVPPIPVNEVTPPPEELRDSAGHIRALVNARKLKVEIIDGFGYYPSSELYYDTEGNVRGFGIAENHEGHGFDQHAVYWKIDPQKFETEGPYYALIKFQDENCEDMGHVLDGKYDRTIVLPTAEGILFFREYLRDSIVAKKEFADRIVSEGLLSVRHYYPTHIIGDPESD